VVLETSTMAPSREAANAAGRLAGAGTAPSRCGDDAPAAGARASEHIAAASAATLLGSQGPSRGRRDDVRHVSAALGLLACVPGRRCLILA